MKPHGMNTQKLVMKVSLCSRTRLLNTKSGYPRGFQFFDCHTFSCWWPFHVNHRVLLTIVKNSICPQNNVM